MYIARIAPADKPDVGKTEQDWSLARAENAKSEADLNELNTQLTVVRNEQKAAKLGVDSAVTTKKSADASADTNRINQATKDLHTAEDVAKAADARVKYFEAYRDFLQRQLRYTQEVMYWREAQYELAKAQTAQKASIAPKGVSFDTCRTARSSVVLIFWPVNIRSTRSRSRSRSAAGARPRRRSGSTSRSSTC